MGIFVNNHQHKYLPVTFGHPPQKLLNFSFSQFCYPFIQAYFNFMYGIDRNDSCGRFSLSVVLHTLIDDQPAQPEFEVAFRFVKSLNAQKHPRKDFLNDIRVVACIGNISSYDGVNVVDAAIVHPFECVLVAFLY